MGKPWVLQLIELGEELSTMQSIITSSPTSTTLYPGETITPGNAIQKQTVKHAECLLVYGCCYLVGVLTEDYDWEGGVGATDRITGYTHIMALMIKSHLMKHQCTINVQAIWRVSNQRSISILVPPCYLCFRVTISLTYHSMWTLL